MGRLIKIWQDLSIRMKLWIYLFMVLIMVSILNLYLNDNNYRIVDQFDETMTGYYTINSLLTLSENNSDAIEHYIREVDEESYQSFYTTKEAFRLNLEQLYEEYDSIEIYFTLKAIDNSSTVYFDMWENAMNQRKNNVRTYFNDYYQGEEIRSYTVRYIQDLLNLSLAEGTKLYNQLADDASTMRQVSLVLIGGIFFIALLIGTILGGYIVKPIKRLATQSLMMSSGELELEPIVVDSKDEVGVLSQSFNIMSESIRKYVADLEQKVIIEKKLHEEELELIKMEQLVKEARFHALQSQINPHFLFNTLNTISRTAMFEEADKTMGLIQALSSLFRYKLHQEQAMIPIKEEIHIIEEYIHIQEVRFNERLKFIVEIDELSQEVSIPIFLLQPVVENAIIHGIEKKIQGGTVRIKIRTKVENSALITKVKILDTGVGIPKQRLELIRKYEQKDNKSIGVTNVYQRFMLAYPETGKFNILSKEGFGTSVIFEFGKEEAHGTSH